MKSLQPSELIRRPSPSLHPAAALASLPLSGSQEYAVRGISIHDDAGVLGVKLEGEIIASGFGNIQANFERILERLGQSPLRPLGAEPDRRDVRRRHEATREG